MCIPVGAEGMAKNSIQVGKGKVGLAHNGKDQFGRDMSIDDRRNLLTSAASDIVSGQKQLAEMGKPITNPTDVPLGGENESLSVLRRRARLEQRSQ